MEESHKRLARDLLRLDDLEGARLLAEAEIEAREQRCSGELWPFRLILFEIQRLHGQTEEALQQLDRMQRLNPPAAGDVESSIGIRKLLGYYSGLLGRYQMSHQLLREAEAMAHRTDLLEPRAEVNMCQAMIYFLQQNYVVSESMFRLVLSLSEQIGGWYFRGSAVWGIGKNLMIQRHYSEAVPWLKQSLDIFENAGANLSVALVWSELSVCYLGLGDDGLALELLQKAEAAQHKAGAIANYQVVLANIGNVHLHRGDHLTAVSYYRRALALAHEIKDPVSIRKWTYNIRLAYARLRRTIDQGNQRAS